MRKQLYEIKELPEAGFVYPHRYMLFIEDYAVLVIINIGRILQEEILSRKLYGNDPVVLPCRMIDPAPVAFIFSAKLAFRVRGLGRVLRRRYRLGVLFGL